MGRGPARPIEFSEDGPPFGSVHQISEDGPRPDPAHHIFTFSRPGPARLSIFEKSPPGPARPGQARPRQTAHDKPWEMQYLVSYIVRTPFGLYTFLVAHLDYRVAFSCFLKHCFWVRCRAPLEGPSSPGKSRRTPIKPYVQTRRIIDTCYVR